MKLSTSLLASQIFLLTILSPAITNADPPHPVSDTFQVNQKFRGDQFSPAVASAGDGFFVAWESDRSPGDDKSGRSIVGRYLDGDGVPQGEDLQINVVTSGDQTLPSVADVGNGAFYVFWLGDRQIRGRKFQVDAGLVQPAGAELILEDPEVHQPSRATAVSLPKDQGFLLTWRSIDGFDSSRRRNFARLYDSEARPQGAIFSFHSGSDRSSVAVRPNGDMLFAVDGGVQIHSASGARIQNLQLHTNVDAAVAANSRGNFVVAGSRWYDPGYNFGTHTTEIFHRTFNAEGEQIRRDLQLDPSADIPGRPWTKSVATSWTDNRFIVAWDTSHSRDFIAEVIAPRGKRQGSFTVVEDTHVVPVVATQGETILFAWRSYDSRPQRKDFNISARAFQE